VREPGPEARVRNTIDQRSAAHEADQYDERTHSGWSVLMTGRAAAVWVGGADRAARGQLPWNTASTLWPSGSRRNTA
jgi:hypothetical protein